MIFYIITKSKQKNPLICVRGFRQYHELLMSAKQFSQFLYYIISLQEVIFLSFPQAVPFP